MLIPEDVLKLASVYEKHMDVITEFVQEASALLKDLDADELWVEEFADNPPIQISALKEKRVIWKNEAEAIPHFNQILAFFRHKDIGMGQKPGHALGRKDGILFAGVDIDHMRQLADILENV
jgi:hypothetical protein